MNLKEQLLQAKRMSEDIQLVFYKEYQELINKYDMSSKQMNLIQFVIKNNFVTMNDIALFLDATPSAASQAVRKLENDRYLKREINLSNRREIHVCLGDRGGELKEELEFADLNIIEKYYMKLTPVEIETYCEIIEKMHSIVVGVREDE